MSEGDDIKDEFMSGALPYAGAWLKYLPASGEPATIMQVERLSVEGVWVEACAAETKEVCSRVERHASALFSDASACLAWDWFMADWAADRFSVIVKSYGIDPTSRVYAGGRALQRFLTTYPASLYHGHRHEY